MSRGKAKKSAAKSATRPAPADAPKPERKVDRARLDVWLWRARFFKTRSLAAKSVEGGRVRVNGARVRKAGHPLKLSDVLTIVRGVGPSSAVDVVTVRAFGERRGPASEAAALFDAVGEAPPGPSSRSAVAGASTPPPPEDGATSFAADPIARRSTASELRPYGPLDPSKSAP